MSSPESQSSVLRCTNGQLVSPENVCDVRDDCLDGSDETTCVQHSTFEYTGFYRKLPPVIIHFDGYGNFSEHAMSQNESCPGTHFSCHDKETYCLPVFLRCNGVNDCPEGEDEVDCDDITCPGYYRCRSSTVCLHADHVCDGWPQCPERDDELLCNATCPSVCHCQGLAFVCHQRFDAGHFLEIRYLDARGSGIVPQDISDNQYLVYLSLADCKLSSWPNITFYNLQRLDISDNNLRTFNLGHLQLLAKLRSLSLRGNPLGVFEKSVADINLVSLSMLDLSSIVMTHFDPNPFTNFASLKYLNLSFSNLEAIQSDGFSRFKALTVIDLSGCNIHHFPLRIFSGLDKLQDTYVSDFRLCCRALFPISFNLERCIFHQDALSSCENLVHSTSHRVYLWSVGLLSVIGNVYSIAYTLIARRGNITVHNALWTNLNIANLFMGLFLLLISIANEVYSGSYFWFEKTWTNSHTCHAAGFLSVLSNEVSVLIICLLTLDRFLVSRSRIYSIHSKFGLIATVLSVVWLISVVFAVITVLPTYDNTSLCIPLILATHDLQGIIIIFNLFISFITSILQYSSIHQTGADIPTNVVSQNLTIARRLVAVVSVDFLCRIISVALSVSDLSKEVLKKEMNITRIVFVQPLSAAINPFLYAYALQAEKQKVLTEERIAKVLKARGLNLTHK